MPEALALRLLSESCKSFSLTIVPKRVPAQPRLRFPRKIIVVLREELAVSGLPATRGRSAFKLARTTLDFATLEIASVFPVRVIPITVSSYCNISRLPVISASEMAQMTLDLTTVGS